LGKAHGKSGRWVRNQFQHIETRKSPLAPQSTVVIVDTTFWGRSYGVCVFRSPTLKRNIWWNEVAGERIAHYHYGRKILEEKGWKFLAAVVDGRRGLAGVFADMPVQICQFHQVKAVTKYLTRKPETEAGRTLRAIALSLKGSTEKEFTARLKEWRDKWQEFISQKTYTLGCKRWHYTHKNVRSAYRSLEANLPYLFTYLKYPELHIPNTTNSLDGSFSQLKSKLGDHRGLSKGNRYKLISELLSGEDKTA
jgi:hypothetical protein